MFPETFPCPVPHVENADRSTGRTEFSHAVINLVPAVAFPVEQDPDAVNFILTFRYNRVPLRHLSRRVDCVHNGQELFPGHGVTLASLLQFGSEFVEVPKRLGEKSQR